jgi:lipopolysaccharide/colanic/teichoic acid biosynthesis glycosyltransferase
LQQVFLLWWENYATKLQRSFIVLMNIDPEAVRIANRNLNSILQTCNGYPGVGSGLMSAAPLMALISAAVWLDSPGPVIFAQDRLGFKGKRFKLYKFRKFAHR